MKNSTFIAMLMLLFFGVATSKAQTTATDAVTAVSGNITNASELTNGAKVIFYNTGRNAYIWDDTNGSGYKMKAVGPVLNDASSLRYVWTVETTANGKFKFKDHNNNYMPVLNGTIKGSANGDEFTVTKNQDKWFIRSSNNNYFNGNAPGGTFVGWGATGGNSNYHIYIATVEDISKYQTVTVKMVDKAGKQLKSVSTINKEGTTVNLQIPYHTVASQSAAGYTIKGNTLTINANAGAEITISYNDAYPFEASPAPQGNAFDANTKWYQLTLQKNSKYFMKLDANNSIKVTDQGDASKYYGDEYAWCFVGDFEKGFKIYNKKAGADKWVCATDPVAMGTAADNSATWKFSEPNTKNDNTIFCFKSPAQGNKCMNYQSGNVKFWWDADDGSTFHAYVIPSVEEQATATLNAAMAKANQVKDFIGAGLGKYTDANNAFANALKMAETNATEKNAKAKAINDAIAALKINQPEGGKFYRFQGSTGLYISAKADKPLTSANHAPMTSNPDDAVFYLTKDMKLVTADILCMSGVHSVIDLGFTTQFFASNVVVGKYVIYNNKKNYSDGNLASTNNHLNMYTRDTPIGKNYKDAAWTIEEVTDVNKQPKLTKTIAAQYATLGAPVALNIPEGIKAYTVKVQNNTALLTEVNKVIPAGTAVVLEKVGSPTSNDFNFTFATEGTATESQLTGAYKDTTLVANENAYVLGKNTAGVYGFFKLSANDRTLAKNKAYLVLPQNAAAPASILIGGQTTGIENAVTETAEEVYFDLQGRRVQNPTKGIYVTKSGKKVLFY